MQKVSAVVELFAVQLDDKPHMFNSLKICFSHRILILALDLIEILPCAERLAHGGADQHERLLRLDLLERFIAFGFQAEIQRLSIIFVNRSEVVCKTWQDFAIALFSDLSGNAWCGVYFGYYIAERLSALTFVSTSDAAKLLQHEPWNFVPCRWLQ